MNYLSLTPAYGRDYKSRAAVLADLSAGKDFQAQPSGSYFNLQDAQPGDTLTIRYARLTKVAVFKHPFNK